jgi:hypothetical protein
MIKKHNFKKKWDKAIIIDVFCNQCVVGQKKIFFPLILLLTKVRFKLNEYQDWCEDEEIQKKKKE